VLHPVRAANLLGQKIVAQHFSQIAHQENILGRHYSRFRPLLCIAPKQYQSLARSFDGENRPRGVRIG
jgi:hypothetical protein